jgi:hypothetical protein
MQQQLTIQDVVNQLEQLLLRIILRALFRLRDQLDRIDRENEMKF